MALVFGLLDCRVGDRYDLPWQLLIMAVALFDG